MQSFTAAQSNTMYADMVAKANGDPITSGTVNFYLMALTGANVGKWYNASGGTWSATEAIAGTGTHQADGHWTASIPAGAWVTGVRYNLYAKESGNLHIACSEEVSEPSLAATSIRTESTVIQD